LLTGATGFIGTCLWGELLLKHKVFAVGRQERQPGEEGVTWIRADLSRPNVEQSLPDKIDVIVYMAQARQYHDFPNGALDVFNVNVSSLLFFLEYARQKEARKFVFTSSANVYKRSCQRITETCPTEATSFYARSKRIGEMLIESYADYFRCVVLRLFTVYGPNQKGTLIPSLAERVRHYRPIEVQGKRGLEVSPIFVTDVSAAIQAVVEKDDSRHGVDVLNVGGDEAVGIYELGCMIGKVLRMSPRFEFVSGEEPGGWIADSSKLKEAFGVGPFITLEDGLQRSFCEV